MPEMQFGRDSSLSLPTVTTVVFSTAADFQNPALQQLRAAHLPIKQEKKKKTLVERPLDLQVRRTFFILPNPPTAVGGLVLAPTLRWKPD